MILIEILISMSIYLGGFVAPPHKPFDYGASAAPKPFDYGSSSAPTPFNYNIPPQQPQNLEKKEMNVNQDFILVRSISCFNFACIELCIYFLIFGL